MKAWNILLIDNSASMLVNTEAIKIGMKDLIRDQIERDSKDRFTVFTFNDELKKIIDTYNLNYENSKCGPIATKNNTALYDSIGRVYDYILESENDIVTLTVITDGYENSSKIYTLDKLRDIRLNIDKKIKLNVSFICSDEECLRGNKHMLPHVQDFSNSEGDYSLAFRRASRTMSNSRTLSNQISPYCKIDVNFSDLEMEAKPILERQNSYIIYNENRSNVFIQRCQCLKSCMYFVNLLKYKLHYYY